MGRGHRPAAVSGPLLIIAEQWDSLGGSSQQCRGDRMRRSACRRHSANDQQVATERMQCLPMLVNSSIWGDRLHDDTRIGGAGRLRLVNHDFNMHFPRMFS